jgi:hypothetical protein
MSLPTRLYEKMLSSNPEEKEERTDYWGHKVTDKEFLRMKDIG